MSSHDTDTSFRKTLQGWKISPVANSNFRPEVWRRIQAASSASWSSYLRRHALPLGLAALVTMLASGWIGHTASRATLDAKRNAMAFNYLVELEPRVQNSSSH